MARDNIERQEKLQPLRIKVASDSIKKLGFYIINESETHIEFMFKNSKVTYFAYTGWATGKSIKDGRGLKNLLKQLK